MRIGIEDSGEDPDQLLEFQYKFVHTSLQLRECANLKPLITRLRSHGADLHRFGFNVESLDLHMALFDGRAVELAALAPGMPPPEAHRSWCTAAVCDALFLLRRFDEAEALIDRLAASEATDHVQLMTAIARIESWYLCRRYDDARQHIQTMMARTDPEGGYCRYFRLLSAHLALAQGEIGQARALLHDLDPDVTGIFRMAWVRLHLLAGDLQAAAVVFAQILGQGLPDLVTYELMFAHEVDAPTTARLYAAAQARLAAPVEAQPSQPPRPIATTQRTVTGDLLGHSPAIAAVRRTVATLAPLTQPVLIEGETGTGKEVVARMLHRQGAAPTAPFVALNCAAFTDGLAESELFGHRKGAFTGAMADHDGMFAAAEGGTLFLDEINSLSPRLQGLLLRVLETGQYRQVGGTRERQSNARIIAASNASLEQACSSGAFRSDLRFRLQRFVVTLPPLRDRPEDIPVLAQSFIDGLDFERPMRCHPDLLALLMSHAWPGNVRELRNLVERMALLAEDRTQLTTADCPELVERLRGVIPRTPVPAPPTVQPGRPGATAPPATDHARQNTLVIPGAPKARERRARILALFARFPHLYAQDVVRELAVVPNTVARDCKALEHANLIRRVITSGNLRTSYWVRLRGAD